MMGYPQIKGELEEDFKKLDFDHCVILRPGLLMGSRYACSKPPSLVYADKIGKNSGDQNGLLRSYSEE
jgi:hypothetical protein